MIFFPKRKKRVIEVNLDEIDPEVLKSIFNKKHEQQPLGDGKAVFLDDGYHEEAVEIAREKKGMKKWYERLKNLL